MAEQAAPGSACAAGLVWQLAACLFKLDQLLNSETEQANDDAGFH
jgi:hypothetical protein